MAYDEVVCGRIQRTVADRKGVTEKKMFGGVAFLLDGKILRDCEGAPDGAGGSGGA